VGVSIDQTKSAMPNESLRKKRKKSARKKIKKKKSTEGKYIKQSMPFSVRNNWETEK